MEAPNMNRSGLRVAAEWEPQACIWLAWPHSLDTWPGRFEAIPTFFTRWVRSIAETTPVRVLAYGQPARQCESMIGGFSNVHIVRIPTNDCWLRDYGPTFVINDATNRIHGVSWQYNSWGGKYPPWDLDNAAAQMICFDQGIQCVESQLSLEGGAIETDGIGRLITTPDCLLTDSRNPGWTRERIESELKRQLGVHEIFWLSGGGLEGDDTDGHIDQIARFIDTTNMVAAVCNDRDDPNHLPLEENYRQLTEWAKSTTPQVTIHRLPIPPRREINGQRVPESYCNFLRLGPDRIQIPIFGAKTDLQAIGIFQDLTEIDVESIDCRDLAWGLGALHCASHEQPAR